MVLRFSLVHNQMIMNRSFRWIVVLTFALLAFAGPLAWAKSFGQQLINRLAREARQQLIAEGKWDAATQTPIDGQRAIGTQLSPEDLNSIFLADLLVKFWWIWGLLVIGCSYGLFVLLGNLGRVARTDQPNSGAET